MASSLQRRRGGQLGNINALKHGFYTRRLKTKDLTGVDTTDNKNLVEEIAIVRVFTRRLIESLDPDADAFEVAGTLRILCVALNTITRAIKAQHWIKLNGVGIDDEISIAIRQVHDELFSGRQQSAAQTSPQQPLDDTPIPSPTFDLPDVS